MQINYKLLFAGQGAEEAWRHRERITSPHQIPHGGTESHEGKSQEVSGQGARNWFVVRNKWNTFDLFLIPLIQACSIIKSNKLMLICLFLYGRYKMLLKFEKVGSSK